MSSYQGKEKKKLRFMSAGFGWGANWDNGDWYCSGSAGSKKYRLFVQDENGNVAEVQRFSLVTNKFRKEEKQPEWVLQVAVNPEEMPAETQEESF